MASLKVVLMILAFLCEALAVFHIPRDERVNLIAAGLACWLASIILPLQPWMPPRVVLAVVLALHVTRIACCHCRVTTPAPPAPPDQCAPEHPS